MDNLDSGSGQNNLGFSLFRGSTFTGWETLLVLDFAPVDLLLVITF